MDRLQHQRSLVALSGLAIVLATTGCRDRNLRVPPPAHYTDGESAVPEGVESYPGYLPAAGQPSGMDSYGVDSYGGGSYAPPNSYDPNANPTSGVYGGADDVSGGLPAGSGMNPYSDVPADFGVPPIPSNPDPTGYEGPYASSSSPSALDPAPFAVENPYAGLDASAGVPDPMAPGIVDPGTPYGSGNDLFPAADPMGGIPPMPDTLPEMP